MRYQEILEDLRNAMDDLVESSRSAPVIVEGEKDAVALRRLGVEGEILVVNAGLPLINFCEKVARRHRTAVIMTDWDAKGGTLCRRLQEGLEACGARADTELRKKIAVLCRKDVKDVEGVPNYLLTLERWSKENRNEGARARTAESLRRAGKTRERR